MGRSFEHIFFGRKRFLLCSFVVLCPTWCLFSTFLVFCWSIQGAVMGWCSFMPESPFLHIVKFSGQGSMLSVFTCSQQCLGEWSYMWRAFQSWTYNAALLGLWGTEAVWWGRCAHRECSIKSHRQAVNTRILPRGPDVGKSSTECKLVTCPKKIKIFSNFMSEHLQLAGV